jgi:predicted esterase
MKFAVAFRCCLLLLSLQLCAALAAEPAALRALPSVDGIVSWWLLSPPQNEELAKSAAPKDVLAGAPVRAENPASGNWAPHVSAARFMDFKESLDGATQGVVWAACRIQGEGGSRRLRAATYSGLRAFLNGKEVLTKAQPVQPYADEADALIELPKGECELLVAVNIRYGYAGFRLQLTDGTAEAGKILAAANETIVLPFAAGKKPDSARATLDAFTFLARDPFSNAGQKTPLLVGLDASIPPGLGPISGHFLRPDGTVASAELPPREPALFNGKNAWQVEFTVPAAAGIQHTVELALTSGGQPIGRKTLSIYSLKGIDAAAKSLSQEISAREERAGCRFPLATLQIEKLLLFTSKILSGEERVSLELGLELVAMLKRAHTYADLEEKKTDPLQNKTGYLERAYVSPIDGAVQPYFAYVPTTAPKPGEKRPLVIFLHGYVPSYDKHRWWESIPEFQATFERSGALLAIPFGRSNTDFQAAGEVDVLDVIAEMKKRYAVDEDRVYLYGYSMGGMAVYHICAHNPDLFAGVIAIAGRADSPLQNKKPLTQFHPFKQWMIQADNPISLCENLINIPLRIYHGKQDFIIDIAEARRMNQRFKDLGAKATLFEMPGDHFFGFDLITTDEPLQWLLAQKRTPPERRWIKQYSLKYAHQGAVSVQTAGGALEPLELQWNVKDGKPDFVKRSDTVGVLAVNGAAEKELPAGLHKTPARCGPVREAICAPFVIVYGTGGTPEQAKLNRENAEKFENDWFAYSRSHARIKADTELSEAEKKEMNLFLFGEEQENSVFAAAAASVPLKVKDGQVTIGARTVPLKERGIVFTYPSPFAAPGGHQVIVVCAGLLYGQHLGANHKLDLVPDFLLFDAQSSNDGTGTNHFQCAGFFDPSWQFSDATTWWQE